MGREREKLRKAIRQAENDFTDKFIEIPESKRPGNLKKKWCV